MSALVMSSTLARGPQRALPTGRFSASVSYSDSVVGGGPNSSWSVPLEAGPMSALPCDVAESANRSPPPPLPPPAGAELTATSAALSAAADGLLGDRLTVTLLCVSCVYCVASLAYVAVRNRRQRAQMRNAIANAQKLGASEAKRQMEESGLFFKSTSSFGSIRSFGSVLDRKATLSDLFGTAAAKKQAQKDGRTSRASRASRASRTSTTDDQNAKASRLPSWLASSGGGGGGGADRRSSKRNSGFSDGHAEPAPEAPKVTWAEVELASIIGTGRFGRVFLASFKGRRVAARRLSPLGVGVMPVQEVINEVVANRNPHHARILATISAAPNSPAGLLLEYAAACARLAAGACVCPCRCSRTLRRRGRIQHRPCMLSPAQHTAQFACTPWQVPAALARRAATLLRGG